jgi:GH43 family beta-xylosidase
MTDVYMVGNTISQNPLKDSNGSDPQIQYWNGQYYLLTTEWTHIAITTSSTLEGLKTAEPKMVHSSDDPSRCCNLWA